MFGIIGAFIGWLSYQLGLRADAGDAAGSALARLKYIIDTKLGTATGTSADTRASNTVMGWLATQVKSVQRGVSLLNAGTYTTPISITSVTTSKAIVRHLGTEANAGATVFNDVMLTITLTNATTLTITRGTNSGDVYISWEVTEYY